MNSNSAIYMGNDGHYHDKPADELEQAPEPIEEGGLEGVQAPADGTETELTGDGTETELTGDGTGEAPPEPKPATAKTRKQ